jgi:hypothetical protein
MRKEVPLATSLLKRTNLNAVLGEKRTLEASQEVVDILTKISYNLNSVCRTRTKNPRAVRKSGRLSQDLEQFSAKGVPSLYRDTSYGKRIFL